MDSPRQEEVFNFQKDNFFLHTFAKAVVFKQSLFFCLFWYRRLIMIKGKIKVAILGASGYTGLEIIRLLINSKNYSISEVTADSKAGMKMSEVYSHLRNYDLPRLKKIDEIKLTGIDAIVSCLPHSKSQNVISSIPKHIK